MINEGAIRTGNAVLASRSGVAMVAATKVERERTRRNFRFMDYDK